MVFQFGSSLLVTLLMITVIFTFRYVSAVDDAPSPSLNDWQSIKDMNDLKVVEIGKFAVDEENKKIKLVKLEFVSVSYGSFNIDNNGDITYHLTLLTSEFDEMDISEAIVFENTKENVRKLISFE